MVLRWSTFSPPFTQTSLLGVRSTPASLTDASRAPQFGIMSVLLVPASRPVLNGVTWFAMPTTDTTESAQRSKYGKTALMRFSTIRTWKSKQNNGPTFSDIRPPQFQFPMDLQLPPGPAKSTVTGFRPLPPPSTLTSFPFNRKIPSNISDSTTTFQPLAPTQLPTAPQRGSIGRKHRKHGREGRRVKGASIFSELNSTSKAVDIYV